MEEEYSLSDDLGRFIEIFVRQWLLILIITIVTAAIAGVYAKNQPESYLAEVILATTNTASTVTYEPTIRTNVEGQQLRGSSARLESYINLVNNPVIAKKVLEKLGTEVNGKIWTIDSLQGLVSGELVSGSDSIKISVRYSDPEMAAKIANEWAEAYKDHINSVFLDSGINEVDTFVNSKLEEAKSKYDSAQENLEEFIINNPEEEYERQIFQTQQLVDQLSRIKVNVISQQINDLEIKLKDAYDQRRQTQKLLKNAIDIREQVKQGGDGAAISNLAALTLLKAQAFAPGGISASGAGQINADTSTVRSLSIPNPLNESENIQDTRIGEFVIQTNPIFQSNPIIQTNPVSMTTEVMIEDLDGLIGVLETRGDNLNSDIEELSTQIVNEINLMEGKQSDNESSEVVSQADDEKQISIQLMDVYSSEQPIEQTILSLEKRIADLNSKLEKADDDMEQLRRSRDLAWDTYQTLANKDAELFVADEFPGTLINIASPAIVPSNALGSIRKNILVGLVFGFILGSFAAFAIEFWWMYKGIEPHPVINFNILKSK